MKTRVAVAMGVGKRRHENVLGFEMGIEEYRYC
jgi:hypothetical protein